MERNSTHKRRDKPARSRAAFNTSPSVAVMDRTGRIHTMPWLRTTAWWGSKSTLQMVIEKLASCVLRFRRYQRKNVKRET
jgi:hypothetical protein